MRQHDKHEPERMHKSGARSSAVELGTFNPQGGGSNPSGRT